MAHFDVHPCHDSDCSRYDPQHDQHTTDIEAPEMAPGIAWGQGFFCTACGLRLMSEYTGP